MYIVSRDGYVHVSPEDVTSRKLQYSWLGTFILLNLDVRAVSSVPLDQLLEEIRSSAQKEIDGVSKREDVARFSVNMFNFFGKWAEDKESAITSRDKYLMPNIAEGKIIDLDFRDVETAPHSFLNALLATPIRNLRMKAYQRIRIYNATGTIREIIDRILEDNVPKLG